MMKKTHNFVSIVCFSLIVVLFTPLIARCEWPKRLMPEINQIHNACKGSAGKLKSLFGAEIGINGTKNVAVKPAKSIQFELSLDDNCDFFLWGQQMFLWVTSPNAGALNLTSDNFYTLVDAPKGTVLKRLGPKRTPVLGIRDQKTDDVGGVFSFGQAGDDNALISFAGTPATGSSATRSPVYYGVHVNQFFGAIWDVVKNTKNGSLIQEFPTTYQDVETIKKYVSQGVPVGGSDQLAMEIKTAWIEADALSTIQSAKREDFILMKANVPKFDKSNPERWERNGMATKTLALVGMHIAGTVGDPSVEAPSYHPEMVWATFEHRMNAPMVWYHYLDKKEKPRLFLASQLGEWLFYNLNELIERPPNFAFAIAAKNGDIVARLEGGKIGPSNIIRENPWGISTKVINAGLQKDLYTVRSELMSFYAAVYDTLSPDDPRRNYIQMGSTWTGDGKIPTWNTQPKEFSGSNRLANATMESFMQKSNCFSCHNQSGDSKEQKPYTIFNLSHIIGEITAIELD